MILQGPGDIQFRDVRFGDEDDIFTLCRGWTHDGRRFSRRSAENAVQKYVNDMEVQPGDHPCNGDSLYREALIAHLPNGDPLALIVYVVRGANDPKNWPLAVHTLRTEAFAINPAYRDQGRMDGLLNTLIRSAFEDTGVDALVHDLVDTPQMRSHLQDRAYQSPRERETAKGTRIEVAFTRAQHQARMAANPSEARQRHVFTRDG